MIYYMSTKTLVNDFNKNQTPEEILESDYISFSSRIIPYKQMKQIPFSMSCVFSLLPIDDSSLLEKNECIEKNIDIVRLQLIKNDRSLCVINNIITENLVFPKKIFIILSSPNEFNTKYPYYLGRAIYDLYKFPVIDYEKDRYKEYTYKPKEVLNRIDYYKAMIILNNLNDETIKKMTIKEKKKLLKNAHLWEKGMTEDDANDILEQYSLPF